jgi:heme/copper-type cytochrome/quinol oxidase subunit 2
MIIIIIIMILIMMMMIIIIIINAYTHVDCKNKGDSSNNRRDWDHFKVI